MTNSINLSESDGFPHNLIELNETVEMEHELFLELQICI